MSSKKGGAGESKGKPASHNGRRGDILLIMKGVKKKGERGRILSSQKKPAMEETAKRITKVMGRGRHWRGGLV